jgi:hypothetical protein
VPVTGTALSRVTDPNDWIARNTSHSVPIAMIAGRLL